MSDPMRVKLAEQGWVGVPEELEKDAGACLRYRLRHGWLAEKEGVNGRSFETCLGFPKCRRVRVCNEEGTVIGYFTTPEQKTG